MKQKENRENEEKIVSQFVLRSTIEKKREIKVKIKSQGNCMEPVIKNGDVVRVYEKSAREISIGDIVLFFDNKENTVIHRVIGIQSYRGKSSFLTKGDNFNVSDGLIPENRIIGVVEPVRKGKKWRCFRPHLDPVIFQSINVFVLDFISDEELVSLSNLCYSFGSTLFIPNDYILKKISDRMPRIFRYRKVDILVHLKDMAPICLTEKGMSDETRLIDMFKNRRSWQKIGILPTIPDEFTPEMRVKSEYIHFSPNLEMCMDYPNKVAYFLGILSAIKLWR